MFPIAYITDEATQSFEEAVRLAVELRLQGLELRSVEDTPIDMISPETLRSYAEVLKKNNLKVVALASSFFKDNLRDPDVILSEYAKLERLCDAADILGTQYIRGFAGLQVDGRQETVDELAELFETPREILAARNKQLLLEADPHVNTSNHETIAALLDRLDTKYFSAIYDPGNSLYDPLKETPFPNGYEVLGDHLRHVHIKDVRYNSKGEPYCLKIGDGLVPYPELLQRLKDDGYQGWLSLETHYRKDTQLTDEQMLFPQGSAFSAGGVEAMMESSDSLQAMLDDLK